MDNDKQQYRASQFLSFSSAEDKSVSPPTFPANQSPHQYSYLQRIKHKLSLLIETQAARRRYISCLMWLFGCSCWVLGFIYPNNHSISPQISLLWRGIGQIILSYLLLTFKIKEKVNIVENKKFLLCTFRSLIIGFNIIIFGFCQFYLPLPYIHTLNSTLPIFTAIIDYFINKTQLTQRQISGMILAFFGVLIVVNNSRQLSQEETKFKNYHNISNLGLIFLEILLLLNACSVAYAFVLTKKLSKLNPLVVVFNNGLTLTVIGGILYHVNIIELLNEAPQPAFEIDFSVFMKGFLFSGAALSIGNCIQVWALMICPQSGKILIMQNFTVVLAYFISIFSYSEPISIISLLGVLLTLYGVYNTLR